MKERAYDEQENQNTAPPEKKPGLTIRYVRYLLLLVMVMVALIFLFSNRDHINGDNFRRLMAKINIGMSTSHAQDGEIRFDTASEGTTVVFKDGFAHATVEKLIITDKNGTEFQNTQLGYRSPRLAANDRCVMVYDNGGTSLMIADSFSVLHEQQTENNIITARMNANGWYVVVTEGDGFLSKVYVYDSSFREVYRYRSLNRYILDAALTPDNKKLAVSAMNIEGAEIVPEILCFKLNKEEIDWSVAFSESPCVQITVKNNGTICGLFSWGMVALSSKGKECGRFELENQVLQCFDLSDGAVNVFVVSAAENGAGRVVICNENGKELHSVEPGYYASCVDYCDGRVAVLGNQKCGVYTAAGKTVWEDTPENAERIEMMDKSAVVVITPLKCVYNGT